MLNFLVVVMIKGVIIFFMLTERQVEWLNTLSDKNITFVLPYDPTSPEKFEKLKKKVWYGLGERVLVEHLGASGLGISGQDEIDAYIPVAPEKFQIMTAKIAKIFGEPRSVYPLERARFNVEVDKKHCDLFVINETHPAWLNSLKFENYLKTNSDALEAYRNLKESLSGKTTREYYTRKNEFINEILALTNQES